MARFQFRDLSGVDSLETKRSPLAFVLRGVPLCFRGATPNPLVKPVLRRIFWDFGPFQMGDYPPFFHLSSVSGSAARALRGKVVGSNPISVPIFQGFNSFDPHM